MILLKHKKSGQTHQVSPEAWAKIKDNPFKAEAYELLTAPETPNEVKNTVKRAKAEKTLESDNDGISNYDDAIPSGDAGEEQ